MASPVPVSRRPDFTLADFVLAVATGFVGVFVAALLLSPGAEPATLLVGSLLGQYAGHLIGLRMVVRRRGSSFGALGLHVEPSDGLYLFGGVALQIAVAAAFIPVAELIGAEGSNQALAEQIPTIEGTLLRAGLVLSVALIAPVTEEVMFRGLLPRVLRRWMGWTWAYVLAAFVFAVFHLLGVTGGSLRQSLLLLVPQLFLVGLILGWQARKRRRLGTAIFIHSGFNLVAVLALLFAPEAFA
ncbi:MAG: type II CAAX endopeptidase family protein [Acidimicrobiia bacterium]|nr:type II CAAX endopeptidase family protein [Acidimicrobiia bacterium]